MTKQEIIQEYRAAKNKVKQIGILADLNQVDKQTIVTFLIDVGESVPGNFLPRRRKEKVHTVELEPEKEAFELTTTEEPQPAGLTVAALLGMLEDINPKTRIIGVETISVSTVYSGSTGEISTVVTFG